MRQPKPWFHKQSGKWKVQFGKRQVNLGSDEKAAWEEYHKLMSGRQPLERVSGDPTVYDVLNRYLAFCEAKWTAGTFANTQRHLKRFAAFVGKRLKVSELTTDRVHDWIKSDYRGCSPTYQNDAISCVVSAMKHSRLPNPIDGIEKPTRRQREFWLRPEQWQILLDAIKGQAFRDYCLFALHTGARPQETRAIEARHYDRANSRIVFPKSEAKGKKRPRLIYLDDVAREIIERNLKKSGAGIILRNTDGEPWCKNSVNCRFQRLKKTLKMPELCAYTLRHSYAVWKLTGGEEVAIVAKLMGHLDSRMVEQRYGHIEQNVSVMLRAATRTSSPVSVPVPVVSIDVATPGPIPVLS